MIDIQQLEEASASYYAGDPIMTDAEFDTAIIQLTKDDPDHPFLKRVGVPVPGTKKAKHQIPMGSLTNANNEDDFRAWIPDNKPYICLTHKLDGSSLELLYDHGQFIQAITRGDGAIGEDVTKNVLRSKNVPLSINPLIISVRCECLIYKSDWEKHFKGDANPRNSAAGTLRRHDGHNAEYLQFYAFDSIVDETAGNSLNLLFDASDVDTLCMLAMWFKTPAYKWSKDCSIMIGWYKTQETMRDELPYEIDGIVAKIDDRRVSKKMGTRDGRPKGQIAIKFKPRGGESILRKVVWQVGHTGALTPVGEIDPVGVGGIIIQRVTLCNLDEIERLGIAIGDTVEVIRAGDVIPKLLRLIKKGTNRQPILRPFECPQCRSETQKDGARIFCNNNQCPGSSFARVMTWIKKRNILNLGEGIVQAAGISNIYQLYRTDFDQWANTKMANGALGPKRAKKILEALENSRLVSLPDFLGSIGIPGIGRRLSHKLCDSLKLKTIDALFSVLPIEVSTIEGFGVSRANELCTWLSTNGEEVYAWASYMNFEDRINENSGILHGEVICFTGKSPKPRSEMSRLAEAAGQVSLVLSTVKLQFW